MNSARRGTSCTGALITAAMLSLSACGGSAPAPAPPASVPDDSHGRLPTGVHLDPAGSAVDVGSLPLALAISLSGHRAVLSLNGWRERGIQIVDHRRGTTDAPIPLGSAFLGLAFSPDGRRLAASGGNADCVYLFTWRDGNAFLDDSILLVPRRDTTGIRYPAGLAWSRTGSLLYVVENLADSLAVVDVARKQVLQRFPLEPYPYGVVVSNDGTVYASAWGGTTVSVFADAGGGALAPAGRISVGRHPSAIVLNASGTRLYAASASTDRVAVVDTRRRVVVAQLLDPPPAGPGEGSTPNALALSADGTRLYVAEADNNAVAVFDLSAATAGVASARATDGLIARIPVGWYPAALAALGDTLVVVNAKGHSPTANPAGPNPQHGYRVPPTSYTLGQLNGTVTTFVGALGDSLALSPLTARVARANGWDLPRPGAARYPPFEHVIYIIKENRTFDQVLSDLPGVDGDTSLLFFGRGVSPNHHALAERFGAFDRFFVNGEVSGDGHNWSDAAYAADYVEKTVSLNYADQGRDYDYQGLNRGMNMRDWDDVNEPGNGYLWNAAARAGVTYRDYGEFTVLDATMHGGERGTAYRAAKTVLVGHVCEEYPDFDLTITDQHRVDVWLREFRRFEQDGTLPALTTMTIPNDHTSGMRAGAIAPRAAMADNDLAIGRLVEALSRSAYWKNTVVFILEDDAQNGPDHVDSHRSVLLVISAYDRSGVVHRFTNTTDVLATIGEILHLAPLSQFDHYGRPLRDLFTDRADLTPYTALAPAVDLAERNPSRAAGGGDAAGAAPLDLSGADRADAERLNREIWRSVKGELPYPGTRRGRH